MHWEQFQFNYRVQLEFCIVPCSLAPRSSQRLYSAMREQGITKTAPIIANPLELRAPILGLIMPNMSRSPESPAQQPPAGLADALFPSTRQRVLACLFGRPSRSFYATELMRLTGGGSGAVQRELARLTQSGLATARRVGNQKHYQANPESPIFSELRGIVEKTLGLAEPLRQALAPMEDRIVAAFVFGSVAKREDRADSDIDLMVISDALAYSDVFAALAEVEIQLGRPIHPTLYSQKDFSRRAREGHAFVKRALSQPKIWLLGDESDLASG